MFVIFVNTFFVNFSFVHNTYELPGSDSACKLMWLKRFLILLHALSVVHSKKYIFFFCDHEKYPVLRMINAECW